MRVIPYFLLIAIPFIFIFVAIDRTSSAHPMLCIGSSRQERIQQKNIALPVFFIMLFLMLVCRAETVGTDTFNYRHLFEVYTIQPLQYFDLWRSESLFRLLNWSVGQVTDNFQMYLVIIEIVTLTPMAILYCEDRRRSFLKIVLFSGMATFVVLFSGVRQMMAVGLGVLAYMCVRKKKWVLFLVISIIAVGFHHSAFMILLMYPLYHMRLKKNHLWFVLPIVLAVFVFNRQIFALLNTVLAAYDESYEAAQTASTGAYMSLILFVAFAVFSYIVPDESEMDEEMYGLRNFLLLTVMLQCFAPLHPWAMRMNYYYIIFLPITVAKFVDIPQASMKRIAKIAAVVIVGYFLFDFINNVYSGYVTGSSTLDTVPYVPFWA